MRKIYFVVLFIFINRMTFSQNWQQFGNGIPMGGFNFYLDSINNKLYLLGEFKNQISDTVLSPAIWDGTQWIPVGSFDFNNVGSPYKVLMYKDTLYIVGDFRKSQGAPGNFILKLNGNIWDTLHFSPDQGSILRCLYDYHSQLYIGGSFYSFGPLSSSGLIIYQSPFWATVPPILYIPWVETMNKFNGNLIIGGTFGADQVAINYRGNIIAWNGFNFLPLGDGLDLDAVSVPSPIITDIEIYNGKLFVAGSFYANNVNYTKDIVCWDGLTWNEVGGGINYDVRSLQVYNGSLYAAGSFWEAGGIPADYIAKWDGTKWCSLGSSFNGAIFDMCVYNNELIITGAFTTIDGQPINHIAKWIGGNYTDSCQVVGIDELNIQDQFFVYPSPAKGYLLIKSNHILIENIKVKDLTGKEIYTEKNNSISCQLDVSFLNSGLYFLVLETKEGNVVKKFVKQ